MSFVRPSVYLYVHTSARPSPLFEIDQNKTNKTGVINDPLGQTHSHASSQRCFLLFCFSRFEKWGWTYLRTTCVKTMIPTGRDFGLAEWIIHDSCLVLAILTKKWYETHECPHDDAPYWNVWEGCVHELKVWGILSLQHQTQEE